MTTSLSEPLKETLRHSIVLENAANRLREAEDTDELVETWQLFCDNTTGDVREALRQVYAEVLAKLTGGLRV